MNKKEPTRKAITKFGKWQCVRCGCKNYQKELLFSKACCKCGIGRGNWASQYYKVFRMSMNRNKRIKDDHKSMNLKNRLRQVVEVRYVE